jgi:hypothetical protein
MSSPTGEHKTPVSQIDLLARAGAVLLVLLYGLGFLIVSVHRASYGMVQFELLRPKLLSAGILFSVLFVLPALEACRAYGYLGYQAWTPNIAGTDDPRTRTFYYVHLVRLFQFFASAVGLAFLMVLLLEDHNFSSWAFGIYVLFMALAATVFTWQRPEFQKNPGEFTILVMLVVLFEPIGLLAVGDIDSLKMLFWILLVGAVTLQVMEPIERPVKLRHLSWHTLILSAVGVVGIFAFLLYPRISQSLGGGGPTEVVLQFGDKSPIDNSAQTHAWLIDENDSGLYILRSPGDKNAVFIPRHLISAIYYGKGQQPTPSRKQR